jgi:transcription-repair coupling factor (superfamily II helicase)
MIVFSQVIKSYRPFAVAKLLEKETSALIVLSRDHDVHQFTHQLECLLKRKILKFVAWDCLPYDRVSPSIECIGQRVDTLVSLAENPKQIVVTSVAALSQYLPPRLSFLGESLNLKKGLHFYFAKLQSYLIEKGFHRVEVVYEPGDYAIRGDIIDFFPIGFENPYRVDFFGDEVERIRQFDALTQASLSELNEIIIQPVREIILTKQAIDSFTKKYREQFPETYQNSLYKHIAEGHLYAGYEHWLPLYFDHTETLLDYITPEKIIVESDASQIFSEQHSLCSDYYQARTTPILGEAFYNPLPVETMYWDQKRWDAFLKNVDTTISSLHTEGTTQLPIQPAPSFLQSRQQGQLFEHLTELKNTHPKKQFIVTAPTEGARDRLEILLKEHIATPISSINDWPPTHATCKPIYCLSFPLEEGFVTQDQIVLTEQDLLGSRKSQKIRKNANAFKNIHELNIGDYVVHREHGIAKYQGLQTLDVNDQPHDCLVLEYADKNKLFLPVENLELLSRYGSDDMVVELDRLGTAHWQNRKAKVRKRLLIIADYLIKLAAERSLQEGETFLTPKVYDEFCARFPYPETDDQLRAIEEVLGDLASGKPMDRLVCGDVGFGKTEVALRAAFAVAATGKQVVVVTPTTLLCRQHFQNFFNRFHGFDLRVAQLSRLVKARDTKRIREEIKNGDAKVIIATHAILSEKTEFHDLGLLIIDEEQHFGVKQKEKLKKLKPNVHILTLTATPIPRTLQLALAGVRELSLIATPPIDRLSIRTFIMPFDPVTIKEALMREYHRGGQSFFVVPRIEDIKSAKETLETLLPDFRIAAAHGQLPATELENIITDFCDRKYDILLATNIVESGIDMPWVNTIILHRADRFGLAQLYQLRGRVGRTKIQAYAYLTLPPEAIINDTAKKRLEVMQSLDQLGAGFKLASHDMDIRGCGNVVGEEQSGHIKEVGVELYQTLLHEAILQVRAEHTQTVAPEEWTPQLNLGLSLLIPETYISDLSLRLSLYRRLATLGSSEEIHTFAAELVDRFGKIPYECENLLKIIELKIACKRLNIEKIDAGPKGLVISFYKNQFAKPEALLAYIQSSEARKLADIRIRPDQKVTFLRDNLNPDLYIKFCLAVLKQLKVILH